MSACVSTSSTSVPVIPADGVRITVATVAPMPYETVIPSVPAGFDGVRINTLRHDDRSSLTR